MPFHCFLNNPDGYGKKDSFDCDLHEILCYKNKNCFAYDGKRVRWTDSFEMLKIFTKYAIEQPGNDENDASSSNPIYQY